MLDASALRELLAKKMVGPAAQRDGVAHLMAIKGLSERRACCRFFAWCDTRAEIGALVEDYFGEGKRWWVRLAEKGGKRHEMPAHHNLESYMDAYIHAAGLKEAKKSPLFRSARGRTGELTDRAMHRVDAFRMIQRRAHDTRLAARAGFHTFRATGITAYLDNGGTLENAQFMAAHESPRTTKLYDRTGDEITLDEVERIAI